MNEIHALGAAVCMATSGAKQIVGGNWQIFDRMLKEAKAKVHLKTVVSVWSPNRSSTTRFVWLTLQVRDIIPVDSDYGRQFWIESNSTTLRDDEPFDLVFFAAPWHSSPLSKSVSHLFDEKIP